MKIKNTIPICFASYKHRASTLLDRLEQVGNRKVYCFIYETDKDNYESKELYESKYSNLTITYMPEEYKTALRMRLFVQEFMADKEPMYFHVDDDIDQEQIVWDLNAKSFKRKTTLLEALDTFEEDMEKWLTEEDFKKIGIVGPTVVDMLIVHRNDANTPFAGGMLQQAILLNNKLLLENGIKYSGDLHCAEDTEIVINTWRKGLITKTYNKWLVKFCEKMGSGKWYTFDDLQLGLYRKYGDYLKPTFNNNLNHCLFNINWPKLKRVNKGKEEDVITWKDVMLKEAVDNMDIDKCHELCKAYKTGLRSV